MLVDLVERLSRLRSVEDVSTLEAMSMLGFTYMCQDRLEEAENTLTAVYQRRQSTDPRDAWSLQTRGNLAIVFYRLAKLDEAIAMDHDTLPLATEVMGEKHLDTLSCRVRLGLSYLEIGRTKEGRGLLESALNESDHLPDTLVITRVLANSYMQDQKL